MESTVLNRLVAARHLIDSSGPDLTGSSPALLVAQKLLAAHDSSELVFLALTSLPSITPKGRDGQIIKDPSFMTLAQTVIDYAAKSCDFQSGSCLKAFEDLNEARRVFKHRGILVDSDSNMHLFADVVATLDELCATILNEPLLQIDQTSTIISKDARASFTSAREAILESKFKLSLEHTARGLAAAFWDISTPALSVGKTSPEEALLLSGRGIDPASFLSMQKLLPVAQYHSDEVNWNLRKFGHEANWTYNVAQSCLEIAINVAAKLQAIPYRPVPIDFYDFYEDVVEITIADPEVYWEKSHWFSFSSDEQKISSFQVGDQITGHATGKIERSESRTTDNDVDLDYALWIAIKYPRTTRIAFENNSSMTHLVWLRAEQVRVSYQVNEEKARIRERVQRYLEEQAT